MHIFWTRGFDAASISDLTAAMSLNPPSLYAAFGSKEALFTEAVALYAREVGNGIWDHIEEADTAQEAVRHVLTASAIAFTRSEYPHGCMMLLAAPQPGCANKQVADALKAERLESVRLLKHCFEKAQAAGEISPDTDTDALAAYYVAVQHGMTFLARDGASRKTLLTVADNAMAGWPVLTGRP